jgi:ferric-dicitrate binding protein FerR (iron transport regulator)
MSEPQSALPNFGDAPPQWMTLFHAYIDQTLSVDDLKQLESILTEHPHARQTLVDLLALDSALQSDHCFAMESVAPYEATVSLAESADASHGSSQRSSIGFSPRAIATLILAMAASLVVWIGWSSLSNLSEPAATHAVWLEVLEVNDLQLSSASAPWNAGQRLQLSDLKIDAGEVDVKLDSGVTLSLEGPFHAAFENSGAMQLYHGRMSAEVAEQGKGFTVRTATSEVVDLGTRFGISAKADGETDVVVFEGEVKVRRKNNQAKPEQWTTLKSGEAVRVAKQKELQRLARVRLSKNKKIWSSQTSSPSGLVVDVEDNATEPEFLNYLGVVPQGMGVDSQPYSDRPNVRWQPLVGEQFPTQLESIDLVRTFLADRGDRDLEIRIQVSRPCFVYVLIDDRHTPPLWLEREFRKTNLRVRVGPWPANLVKDIPADSDGRTFIPCAVWKCHVDRAGDFVLGSPVVKGSKGQNLMYGIAVAPAESQPLQ